MQTPGGGFGDKSGAVPLAVRRVAVIYFLKFKLLHSPTTSSLKSLSNHLLLPQHRPILLLPPSSQTRLPPPFQITLPFHPRKESKLPLFFFGSRSHSLPSAIPHRHQLHQPDPHSALYLPISSTPTIYPPGEPSPSSLHQHPSPVACQSPADPRL